MQKAGIIAGFFIICVSHCNLVRNLRLQTLCYCNAKAGVAGFYRMYHAQR